LRVMPAVIWRSFTRLIAGNRLFAVVLVPAVALRVAAELGYRAQDSSGFIGDFGADAVAGEDCNFEAHWILLKFPGLKPLFCLWLVQWAKAHC